MRRGRSDRCTRCSRRHRGTRTPRSRRGRGEMCAKRSRRCGDLSSSVSEGKQGNGRTMRTESNVVVVTDPMSQAARASIRTTRLGASCPGSTALGVSGVPSGVRVVHEPPVWTNRAVDGGRRSRRREARAWTTRFRVTRSASPRFYTGKSGYGPSGSPADPPPRAAATGTRPAWRITIARGGCPIDAALVAPARRISHSATVIERHVSGGV